MADKDGRKRTLSAHISQWEQPKLFSRHFQDSKYVGEKNTFFGGWWSDFSTKLKRPLNALFSVGTMNPDTDSASEESVKVIQGRVAHGTLYVRLTCPTMANRHNKLSQVPEF